MTRKTIFLEHLAAAFLLTVFSSSSNAAPVMFGAALGVASALSMHWLTNK